MGAWPSKGKATAATTTRAPPPPPPWAALTPKLLLLVFGRLSSHADRVRFASVCRHWRHVARRFMRWSDLPPKIANLVVRRLPDEADRIRFAAVCRPWRHVASKFWSPWSCLQPELAFLVLRRLMYSHADRVRFAAVCRHWRYVARQYSPPLPPALPWICSSSGDIYESLPDGEMHFPRFTKQELLSGSYTRHDLCYGTFGNWLLLKKIGRNHQFLENPLSGATIRLPTNCEEPVFLYSDGSHGTPSNSRSNFFYIHKLIVCTGDIIVAMVGYISRHQKAVVCCRPGMPSWSMGFYNGNQYQDMVVYMGNLFAVANGGDLFWHQVTENRDTGEPKVSRIVQVIRAPPQMDGYYGDSEDATRCYLVTSVTRKLLLVRWFVPVLPSLEDAATKLKLKVFEADFEMSVWVEVEKLDDQVLFVCSNWSKAMSAKTDCEYLQGNKIYVIDKDIMSWYFWPKHHSYTCTYDLCSKTISPIYQFEEIWCRSTVSWFFP